MITISLCMIVKNEEAVLSRCLDSIQDAVDEIIIVDTGSSDRTKEIAKAYTDHVFEFTWTDDFAAARNYSFSRATKDYCLWLDADDQIQESQKKRLLSWKAQADGTADAVMMKYVTAFDEKGNPAYQYYRERLLKNHSGFSWAGRVHEAIAVHGNVEYLDIAIEHHSQKQTYGTRNLDIYEKMKTEGIAFCARDEFYYARELYYHRRYSEALPLLTHVQNRTDAFVENQVEACRIAAWCSYELHQDNEALKFLLNGLSCRVPDSELCCDIGKHFMDRNRWEQAIFWFTSALHTLPQAESGGFIQPNFYYYIPCIQLTVCFERIGDRTKALEYHKRAGQYKPYGKEYLKNEEYFKNSSALSFSFEPS